MRAILNPRVSSDEQAKGTSLRTQEEKLRAYCKNNAIEIVAVYKEDYSAKDFNRPQFTMMLEYIKKNKGKVDLLLYTTWDRFSRNTPESFAMIEKLKGYGVEVQAIEQPLDLSIPENLLTLSIYLALPDIDNKRRSIKIREGVRAARKAGRWCGKAPFGYKTFYDENGKPFLKEAKEESVVQEIFTKISKGGSQFEIKAALKKKGYLFRKSTFSDLIRNRVYIGEVSVKNDSGERYWVKGLHTPLITPSLFYKVQDIINPKKEIPPAKQKSIREAFLLRGLISCNKCGGRLTGSSSRSRNGSLYDYYHCNHCGEVRLPVSVVHDKVEAIISEIKVTKQATQLYDLMVKKLFSKVEEKKKPSSKIESEIEIMKKRLRKLEDDYADNIINAAVFSSLSTRYNVELCKLQDQLKESSSKITEHQKYVRKGVDVVKQLPKFYKTATTDKKRRIFGSIFTESLYLDEKNCRTAKINDALLLILATDKGLRENKTRQPFKNLMLSGCVELTGIEPLLVVKDKNLRCNVGFLIPVVNANNN